MTSVECGCSDEISTEEVRKTLEDKTDAEIPEYLQSGPFADHASKLGWTKFRGVLHARLQNRFLHANIDVAQVAQKLCNLSSTGSPEEKSHSDGLLKELATKTVIQIAVVRESFGRRSSAAMEPRRQLACGGPLKFNIHMSAKLREFVRGMNQVSGVELAGKLRDFYDLSVSIIVDRRNNALAGMVTYMNTGNRIRGCLFCFTTEPADGKWTTCKHSNCQRGSICSPCAIKHGLDKGGYYCACHECSKCRTQMESFSLARKRRATCLYCLTTLCEKCMDTEGWPSTAMCPRCKPFNDACMEISTNPSKKLPEKTAKSTPVVIEIDD